MFSAGQADWQYRRERSHDLSQRADYHLSDMPAGLKRLIVGGNEVCADTLARINRGMTAASAEQHERPSCPRPKAINQRS